MSILDILESAEGGRFFANAAAACGLDEATARKVSAKVAPAIAQRIKDKSAEDPEAFEALLDMLEDDGNVDLTVEGSLTDQEAQADGAEILNDLYGSAAETNAVFKGLGGGIDKAALSTLTSINAAAVLAALASLNASKLSGGASQAADTSSGGGGFLSVLIAAILKAFMQSAQRQLAPKRRRRRYTSYYGRRAPVRRRRKRSVGLDDVFKDILGGRR
jgi:Bacterial protein of unknown function (DUF937)